MLRQIIIGLFCGLFAGIVALRLAPSPAPPPLPSAPPDPPHARAIFPTTATAATLRALDQRLPQANFTDAPLGDVIDWFASTARQNILVKWDALAPEGITPKTPVTLHLTNTSAAVALDLCLTRLQPPLACRVDENVIIISTRAQSGLPFTITRVYNVRDILTAAISSDEAMAALQARRAAATQPATTQPDPASDVASALIMVVNSSVDPDTWREAGGNIGAIYSLSGCLVIQQTPDAQQRIEQLLWKLREELTRPLHPEARP